MDITRLLGEEDSAAHGQDGVRRTSTSNQNSLMPGNEDRGKSSPLIENPPRYGSPTHPRTLEGPFILRHRAPWDANGYSMPLDRPGAEISPRPEQTPPLSHVSSGEAASPTSPKHRLTDSQSTFASYNTPPSSAAHSRLSSISTTGYEQVMGSARDDSSPRLGPFVDARDITSIKGSPHSSGYLIPIGIDTSKAHKRTASAPDPPGVIPFQSTNPVSPFSKRREGHDTGKHVTEAFIPPTTPRYDGCRYSDRECETDSPLRKAISHIFGRNKVCTRMIPEKFWVHMCRKHYQRSRYRSGCEYANRQCELIIEQIKLVDDWSEENKRKGGIVIKKGWQLSMRKREQNRLATLDRKRSHCETEMGDKHSSTQDSAEVNGTALPDWLREKCGDHYYSTAEIITFMEQLQQQIKEEKRSQIPDVEILPDIVPDSAEGTKPRTTNNRQTPNCTTHKRSKSHNYSMGMRTTAYTTPRGQPNPLPCWNDANSIFPGADNSNHPSLAHRPPLLQYPRFPENCPEQSFRSPRYGYHIPTSRPPVQRRNTNAPSPGRIAHNRSVSEHALPTVDFTFRPGGPSPQHNLRPINPELNYGLPSANNYPPIPTPGFPHPQNDWQDQNSAYNPQGIPRHTRHQSTPDPAVSYYPSYPYDNNQYQDHLGMNGRTHYLSQYSQRHNNPILEVPEPEKPIPGQPGLEQPEYQQSGHQQLGHRQTGSEQPGPGQPRPGYPYPGLSDNRRYC
ncbi:hypothetical protein F5Y10DRAFT_161135 [Nemania abortiva]|nr:hypothetical protein F5Y10DRAFT_161135 [Nemania abortiva]